MEEGPYKYIRVRRAKKTVLVQLEMCSSMSQGDELEYVEKVQQEESVHSFG